MQTTEANIKCAIEIHKWTKWNRHRRTVNVNGLPIVESYIGRMCNNCGIKQER